MEKTSREGAERLHTVGYNAPVFIWSLDKNGIFTLSAGRGLKALGLRSGEVVGKSVFEVYRDVPNFIEDNRRALAGESFVSVVEVGNLVFESHYSPTLDTNGEVIGMIGVATDITDQRDEEEKLAKIFDGVNIPAFAINREHKITHWNTAVESLTGVKREEVVGTDKQWRAFYAKKRPVMADLIIDEAPESEFEYWYGAKYNKSSLIEGAYEASDFFSAIGLVVEDKWLLFTAAPLKDSEGQVVGAIETLQDITEQKQMVNALRDSEAKYRALVESTEDSIYLIDRNCRYIFINEKHLSRIGLPKNRTIGKIYGELHSEAETEEFAKIVEDVFETGNSIQHEHKSSRDGRYILRTLSPVKDSEGRTIAVTVVSKDITERKNAEEERESLLKELEIKNREMESFAYTVSHDLRSPLVTIQGFTTMLQKDIDQNERERAENDLKYIEKAVTKMSALLSDTLALSRIGRIANPPEDVPFGAIVQDALEQTSGDLNAHAVDVSVAEDFPAVYVDRMRIVEVLVNLITNSIKYRGDQPHPKIEIGYRMDDTDTVFFVKDNGIGIDKSQYEKVFELFYRVNKGGEGTGAGLAIVKRIIEVHNGRIWIESEKGKGTTVCFTLPVR